MPDMELLWACYMLFLDFFGLVTVCVLVMGWVWACFGFLVNLSWTCDGLRAMYKLVVVFLWACFRLVKGYELIVGWFRISSRL